MHEQGQPLVIRLLKHLRTDGHSSAFLELVEVDLENFEIVEQVAYFVVHFITCLKFTLSD